MISKPERSRGSAELVKIDVSSLAASKRIHIL